MGLGLGFGLENKDQKKIKGTTKPLMANLDITLHYAAEKLQKISFYKPLYARLTQHCIAKYQLFLAVLLVSIQKSQSIIHFGVLPISGCTHTMDSNFKAF